MWVYRGLLGFIHLAEQLAKHEDNHKELYVDHLEAKEDSGLDWVWQRIHGWTTHRHGGVRLGDVHHRRIELLLLVVGIPNHRAGQRHANGG